MTGCHPLFDALSRAGAPTDYLREQFVVRAYSHDEEIRDAALVSAPVLLRGCEKIRMPRMTEMTRAEVP